MATSTMFKILKYSLFLLFLVYFFVLCVTAQGDQSGFISIDCGQPESSGNYTESSTGINYISDEPFITTGVSETVKPEYQIGYPKHLAHLRAFPEGIRNCYTINVTKGSRYLIRATFYYGNYDGKEKSPGFEVYLGVNLWDTIDYFFEAPRRIEIIHVPLQDYVRVCLANNGTGTPFISALELRPCVEDTYVTQSGSLEEWTRVDLGSITNLTYRYPNDALDRRWYYTDSVNNIEPNWTTISTTSDVNPGLSYKIPSGVMSTAIKPPKDDVPLVYSFYSFRDWVYYGYLHFAEIEELKANESRSFDIFLNGEFFAGPIVPNYLNVTTISRESPLPLAISSFQYSNFTFIRRKNSTLPPILNAIEIYYSRNFSEWETNQDEVEGIAMIKSTYGVKRNWDGDPCSPMKYKWTGLSCAYQGSNPPRITALNLSSSGLNGEITPHIANLTMLEYLDLSNNGMKGTIPKFLSELPNLKVLNLENNNFTGPVPAELIEKSKKGSLMLSFDNPSGGENSTPCTSSSCGKKKKNNPVIPLVASGSGLILLILVGLATLIVLKRKNKLGTKVTRKPGHQNSIMTSKKRQFSYSDVVKITNNFERVLGKGGFGTVYHGFIDGTQVAVKKLSHSTAHGYRQFHAEVKLLMTVHHRNLTSLVGYCIEGTNMALIYEYMNNGDFDSHLLGNGNTKVLSWEERLQIALDSAQGLEYLHNGCKPLIVHRDIKTTNILLTDNFQAKLADFGLSRSFPTEGETHVSTFVAGTPGYLDPEYSTTSRLTEYSDVYSFGVVLLQIITSRCAILIIRGNERVHISQWVNSMLSTGDIKNIVDRRLNGEFDTNSVWKVVEIAMASVSSNSNRRPSMTQVVSELKECLAAELARKNYSYQTESSNSPDVLLSNTTSEFSYVSR